MRLRCFSIWLIIGLCTATDLQSAAQSTSNIETTVHSTLTRVQHVWNDEDVCALVNTDGGYRLERRFPRQTRVYVGTVTPQQLQELNAILNVEALKEIYQQNIQQSLIGDSLNMLLIDVFRPEGSQHLRFMDSASMKPFRAAVDPVLDWLDRFKKTDHTEISPESASHCAPGGVVELEDLVLGRTSYLMILRSSHVWQRRVESSCVLMHPDGRYRREKRVQEYSGKVKAQASSGRLSDEQQQQLQGLLKSEELLKLEHSAPTDGRFRESESPRSLS